MSIDTDQQRDYDEERYWREFCQACGTSPCGWDGRPDGFHTEANLDALADRITADLSLGASGPLGITTKALDAVLEAVMGTPQIAGGLEDITLARRP